MTGRYFAITRFDSEWIFVCAGADPTHVYQDACDILHSHSAWHDEETVALIPQTESQLAALRVVPESVAREQFRVRFRPTAPRIEE